MVVLWVFLVAFVAAAIAGVVSMSRVASVDPIDPAAEERWLVARLRRFPRLAHFVRRRLDRETAGGLLVTAAFAVTFVTALLFGFVLDMVNHSRGLAEWDDTVSEWGSENAGSGAVDVLKFVTDFGGTQYLALAMLAVGIFDYVRHRRRDVFLFLLIVVVGEVLLTNGLKLLVDRDRPSVLRLTGASGPSFPSGHSAAAAACWAAMALVLTRASRRNVRAAGAAGAAFIAAAVATSRALLGVHWLTDIVAGLILGWGWFTLVAIAFGGRLLRLGEPAERLPPTTTTADDVNDRQPQPATTT
jgi:membrane-associated phospholipid phosphatase